MPQIPKGKIQYMESHQLEPAPKFRILHRRSASESTAEGRSKITPINVCWKRTFKSRFTRKYKRPLNPQTSFKFGNSFFSGAVIIIGLIMPMLVKSLNN